MRDESENNQNPNNQPGQEYYTSPEDRYEENQQPPEDAPAVSAPAAKNFVFMAVFGLIIIGIVYAFFSGSDKGDTVTPVKGDTAPLPAPRPVQAIVPPAIEIPEPVVPPEPPVVTQLPSPDPVFTEEEIQERQRRRTSNLLVANGGILGSTSLGGTDDGNQPKTLTEVNDNDPNVGFADTFYNQNDTPIAQARNLGDTSRLITQGKIIESILETPINTDIPGMIRAIVSRDIYAESGRTILIPKGSRLVGTYNNFVIRGNKRVNIIWSRVIRPDGIDIMIRSGGTDQLGRAGIEGEVDNKYIEIFSNAFLVSAISITLAAAVDEIDPDQYNQTNNTDGSSTRNTSAKQEAVLQAVDMFGNTGRSLVDGFLNLKPTITIDQGTRVNVFVNRDLIFPANLSSGIKFVQ